MQEKKKGDRVKWDSVQGSNLQLGFMQQDAICAVRAARLWKYFRFF